MHNELLPLKLTNCIFRKKCEGGGDGDGEEKARNGKVCKAVGQDLK
jgi:hypothetical protein